MVCIRSYSKVYLPACNTNTISIFVFARSLSHLFSVYIIIESVLGYECEYVDECDEGFVCERSEDLDYMTCQCPTGQFLSPDRFTCEGI